MRDDPKIPRFPSPRPRLGSRSASGLYALLHRLLSTIFGLLLFSALLGLAWLMVGNPLRVSSILVLLPLAFIGLFGLNLAVQSVLGRSTEEGFFYSALDVVGRFGPTSVTLGVPLLLVAALLCSLLLGPPEEPVIVAGFLTGWLTMVAHLAVHEWGHSLAAKGADLEPVRVVAGPLELRSSPSGWEAHLCREWYSAFSGRVEVRSGSGVISPLQSLKLAVGGPLATALAVTVLLHWNPYSLEQLLRGPEGPVGFLFHVGICGGFLLLFVNLLPIRRGPGGFPTDGWQIREAIRALRASRG